MYRHDGLVAMRGFQDMTRAKRKRGSGTECEVEKDRIDKD